MATKAKRQIEEIEQALTPERKKKEVFSVKDLLSSGYAPLNMGISGRVSGAYPKGKYILIGGVSDAAKTFLGLSALAEACINPEFDDYRLIYDPVEDGADMDKAFFFGDRLAERAEPLHGTREEPSCSRTVEDLYDGIKRLFDQEEPFILVVDSETALGSLADEKKEDKQRKAREKNLVEKGTYGTEKARYHSRHLRGVRNKLSETKSILILISQLRANLGYTAFANPHSRPGGDALKYYAAIEIWTFVKKTIKKDHKGKKRQQGQIIQIKVKRTRITGKKPTVEMPIYHDSGIDDVGGCIDYLRDEKYWQKKGKFIVAPELDFKGTREALIRHVEENNLEKKLHLAVKKCWLEIEQAVAVKRKSRYA